MIRVKMHHIVSVTAVVMTEASYGAQTPLGVSVRALIRWSVRVTCVGVRGGGHRAVPQGVRVLVVLWEPDPPHAGVQHHRGAALAQRAVAGCPGHHSF